MAAGRLVVAGPAAVVGGAAVLASRWEAAGAAAVVVLCNTDGLVPGRPSLEPDQSVRSEPNPSNPTTLPKPLPTKLHCPTCKNGRGTRGAHVPRQAK